MKIKEQIINKLTILWKKREVIYTVIILSGVILTITLMYIRAFYGTELTDEAYYVSEAKEMLNGNIPFSYNNSSKALGFTFFLIVVEAVYMLFVPNLTGVFLFTRLCFVTYKVIICFTIYRVLQRKAKIKHALLLTGMLLPINGYLQNFSYNTVPIFTMLLSGCMLYDVIEQDVSHRKARLIISGFMTGIACFSNPGWTIALLVFVALILIDVKDRKERIKILCIFGGAALAEVLIVVAFISIQTSFSEFLYGVYRLFINPIPMDSINPNKTWEGVIYSFREPFMMWTKVLLYVSILTFIFSSRYISEGGEKLSKRQCMILAITTGMCVHLIYLAYVGRGTDMQASWAFVAFCYMIILIIVRAFKGEKIIWYLGIYPPVCAVAEIIFLSNGANIGRFVNAYTTLIPVLYILLKNKSELIRIVSTIITVVLTVSLGYADFHYMYRDDNFHSLNYRVQSGVYKGIYTTEARSEDLPEMEEYLNSIIGEKETYAFRDNVPSAYLMVHKGTACEISTWDIMQYSYKRNSPAVMFDYYRRRDMIPDKIIYVDFGRDENLSIVDPEYKYNDWVNEYYDLIEETELNETYFHVMVYQYNGTFDGDYQYWIDTYL